MNHHALIQPLIFTQGWKPKPERGLVVEVLVWVVSGTQLTLTVLVNWVSFISGWKKNRVGYNNGLTTWSIYVCGRHNFKIERDQNHCRQNIKKLTFALPRKS